MELESVCLAGTEAPAAAARPGRSGPQRRAQFVMLDGTGGARPLSRAQLMHRCVCTCVGAAAHCHTHANCQA